MFGTSEIRTTVSPPCGGYKDAFIVSLQKIRIVEKIRADDQSAPKTHRRRSVPKLTIFGRE
jgi:hypothetical protein